MASARSEAGVPNSAPASGQLDFYEAMADFRTMFPKLDPDVIEAVLRANNGVVESTIDNLLKLNEGNEEFVTAQVLRSGASGDAASDHPPPSYDAATAAERHAAKAAEAAGLGTNGGSVGQQRGIAEAATSRQLTSSTKEEGATGGYRNWKPPLLGALPEDFLRLTTGGRTGTRASGRCRNCGRHHHHHRHHHRHTSGRRTVPQAGAVGGAVTAKAATLATGSAVSEMDTVEGLLQRRLMENEMKRRSSASSGPGGLDADQQQCLDDERMAIMLQNEEFLRMLRRDADFMRALHSDRTNGGPPLGNGEAEDRVVPRGADLQLTKSEAPAASLERTHPLSEVKDENEELRRQLKHMGKSSKKKFADLAKRFFTVRYKKKQPSIPFYKTDMPTESTMNLLEDDEADEESRHLRQREEAERARGREPISFEPLPGSLPAVPSYRTVQRPMYHPDCVSTFHDDHKDMV